VNIIPLLIIVVSICLIGFVIKKSRGANTELNWKLMILKYILFGTISIIPWLIGDYIFVKYQNQDIDSKVINYTAAFSILILVCSFTYLNISYFKEKDRYADQRPHLR